jgi:hypothetical protein
MMLAMQLANKNKYLVAMKPLQINLKEARKRKVMYPLANQLDYIELRFSLRSVEKYISEPIEVVIVSEMLPDWITNITHLRLKDIPGRKQLSIRRKILAGLEYSKEVFFMNDDIYLLKPTDTKDYPYYFSGDLSKIGEGGARPLMNQLQAQGKPKKHFDIHVPIIYESAKFKALEGFGADCIIKSMYCNYHEIEGIDLPDFKINKKTPVTEIMERIKSEPCFSTGPQGLQSALPVLEKLYLNKSKYENNS